MILDHAIEIKGFVVIKDAETKEILLNTQNGVHYENMSVSLAESLSGINTGPLYHIAFGNGGTLVDPTGIITYLTPNTFGTNSSLYNQTYSKVIANSVGNSDPFSNRMQVRHTTGTNYTDTVITCLLDYGEPANQDAFDTALNQNDAFVFDELGLISRGSDESEGRLVTHAIFHPLQKSLNRQFEIEYTLRVQSLTGV